jgi:hypothetical protein
LEQSSATLFVNISVEICQIVFLIEIEQEAQLWQHKASTGLNSDGYYFPVDVSPKMSGFTVENAIRILELQNKVFTAREKNPLTPTTAMGRTAHSPLLFARSAWLTCDTHTAAQRKNHATLCSRRQF